MMNIEDVYESACRKWIYSACLYENGLKTPLTDTEFDSLSVFLSHGYGALPSWFTNRVPLDNLTSGTALGIEFNEEDLDKAIEWSMG